ncbi:hypothetical protein F8S12_27825 [Nostoc sp. WHI]|nr:hypothetical protein [Nostoc sp. WHI]
MTLLIDGIIFVVLQNRWEQRDLVRSGKKGAIAKTYIRPIRKLTSQYLQGFETSPCRFCFNEEIRV